MTYYNEIDLYACHWLANLAESGLLPSGRIDRRSIRGVKPSDLSGHQEAHFFAGIGGWPLALRLAGWPPHLEVWTGSCPCQPFSTAGRKRGTDDERHLWPEWYRLIRECRPRFVFGEQVASPDGRRWLSGVRSDLEDAGYAVWAADLAAAGLGAPHIRQRLWFGAVRLGYTDGNAGGGFSGGSAGTKGQVRGGGSLTGGLGDLAGAAGEADRRMGESGGERREEHPLLRQEGRGGSNVPLEEPWTRPDGWGVARWVPCGDGKLRPLGPGIEPLVDGFPGRMEQLRAFGNAIVPQVAATFIRATLEGARNRDTLGGVHLQRFP